jgi:hypothetical protein
MSPTPGIRAPRRLALIFAVSGRFAVASPLTEVLELLGKKVPGKLTLALK